MELQRIEHPEQQGQRQQAVRLAKSANLISLGAAFGAWDEAGQVAVSAPEDEFYQPSLTPADWMAAIQQLPMATPDACFGSLIGRVHQCLRAIQPPLPERYYCSDLSSLRDLIQALREGDYRWRPLPAR